MVKLSRYPLAGRVAAAPALLSSIVLMAGCGVHHRPGGYSIRADGHKVPKRWSGAIPPAPFPEGSASLNFNALYVLETRDPKTGPDFHYYRFWPGGACCQWRKGAMPQKVDGETFGPTANVGRYAVAGDQLTVETVGVDETGAKFVRRTGKVRPDGSLAFTVRRPFTRGSLESEPLVATVVYQPVPVGPMRGEPDW